MLGKENGVATEIKDLLLNREQIMGYATSGYSDSRSSMDARRLDQIEAQLAGFGITDSTMTVESFEEDLERGLIQIPGKQSSLGSAFQKMKSFLGGSEQADTNTAMQERIAKITGNEPSEPEPEYDGMHNV